MTYDIAVFLQSTGERLPMYHRTNLRDSEFWRIDDHNISLDCVAHVCSDLFLGGRRAYSAVPHACLQRRSSYERNIKSGINWHWSAEINPLFDGINSVKIVPSNVICRLPIWLFTWPSSMQVSCAKLSTNKRITILHHEVELYKMHSKILFVRSHYRKWAQVQ